MNRNDLPIPDKRGRAVYRVEVEKSGRDGAAVLRHVFRVDESIPVFAEDAAWLGARLRGERDTHGMTTTSGPRPRS